MGWLRSRWPAPRRRGRPSPTTSGKPIAAVRFVIEGRDTADPSLSDLVETRVGRPLSMADVRESLVAPLQPRAVRRRARGRDPVAGAWRERPVRSQPRPPGVASRRSPGSRAAPGVDEDRLRRAVAERGGTSLRVGRAAELALAVKDAMRERGYLNAAVTPGAQIAHAPHTTTLVFTIDPGTAHRARHAERDGLARRPGAGAAPAARAGHGRAVRSARRSNARIEKYLSGVRSRGYYEAKVTPAVSLADGDRVANLTVAVDRGPARARRVRRRSAAREPARRARAGRARGVGRARTCSRIRRTASRSSCARRDTATPRRRTRAPRSERRAGDHVQRHQGPGVSCRARGDLGQHGAAGLDVRIGPPAS